MFFLRYQLHHWLLVHLVSQYNINNQLIIRDITCVYRMLLLFATTRSVVKSVKVSVAEEAKRTN